MAGAFHRSGSGKDPFIYSSMAGNYPQSAVGMWGSLTGYLSPPGTALQVGRGKYSVLHETREAGLRVGRMPGFSSCRLRSPMVVWVWADRDEC